MFPFCSHDQAQNILTNTHLKKLSAIVSDPASKEEDVYATAIFFPLRRAIINLVKL